jgi:hypothetical protein
MVKVNVCRALEEEVRGRAKVLSWEFWLGGLVWVASLRGETN